VYVLNIIGKMIILDKLLKFLRKTYVGKFINCIEFLKPKQLFVLTIIFTII
jgi:hypothetical protein